ncbi:unnamed protein product, partial [Rotaria sp. Silwood1]
TLNVYLFLNASSGECNIDDLRSILKPFDLCLLAGQEVFTNERLDELTKSSSFLYSIYDADRQHSFDNAIASRYPLESCKNQSASFLSDGVTRSILKCHLHDDHPCIENHLFTVIHLDHLNDSNRLKQSKAFTREKDFIDILLGDINALTRDDYSDDYYKKNIV